MPKSTSINELSKIHKEFVDQLEGLILNQNQFQYLITLLQRDIAALQLVKELDENARLEKQIQEAQQKQFQNGAFPKIFQSDKEHS